VYFFSYYCVFFVNPDEKIVSLQGNKTRSARSFGAVFLRRTAAGRRLPFLIFLIVPFYGSFYAN
jgi:hypothetical protein